jgi:nicotinamidase-related amidase
MIHQIRPGTAVLLVVDIQERLLPAIDQGDAYLAGARRMVEACKVLDVPMLVTEQYPAGLGNTCPDLKVALGDAPVVTKLRFSACVEETLERLREHNRPHVIVVGIEAHVCVLQSVLDLLRAGFVPYVCADAVGSRRPLDREVALDRLRHAGGIITTTESVTLEMLGEAGTDLFKRILPIIK